MKHSYVPVFGVLLFLGNFSSSVSAADAPPALTIYNKGFGVVRETLKLDLKAGENKVTFDRATARVEPDSVILRDITGKRPLRILEQNYEGDVVSQELLLSKYEGQTISFLVKANDGTEKTITGKIIRSGFMAAVNRYGTGMPNQPILEIEGSLRFGLPGIPIFPSLGTEAILKPTLSWTIETDKSSSLDAELSYITSGLSWEADYNLVAPAIGDTLELTGLVTIGNQTGHSFSNAQLKLMAGDVSKIQQSPSGYGGFSSMGGFGGTMPAPPAVTERAFDEYHLYTLARPTTLQDKQTKQVEFVHSEGIAAKRIYVYDGVKLNQESYYNSDTNRLQREYGTISNPKVWVMREFVNSKANHLGIPLPKGKVRFYCRDNKGGALEFVGENVIDHTPQGETLRVYTGDAFDLVGERRQVSYKSDPVFVDEVFEIRVRNRKKEPTTVRVVEHLYRYSNWEIVEKSDEYTKKDSNTIEFSVALAPDQEKVITYKVHYSWQ